MAERFVVAGPRRVEDDVGVKPGRTSRLRIDDSRADLDLLDVRRRDRAELTCEAVILRALFQDMEISASHGRRR
jgi:hypothetical protein